MSTKDPKWPYYGHFVVNHTALVVKRAAVPGKVLWLDVVLGVGGLFSLFQSKSRCCTCLVQVEDVSIFPQHCSVWLRADVLCADHQPTSPIVSMHKESRLARTSLAAYWRGRQPSAWPAEQLDEKMSWHHLAHATPQTSWLLPAWASAHKDSFKTLLWRLRLEPPSQVWGPNLRYWLASKTLRVEAHWRENETQCWSKNRWSQSDIASQFLIHSLGTLLLTAHYHLNSALVMEDRHIAAHAPCGLAYLNPTPPNVIRYHQAEELGVLTNCCRATSPEKVTSVLLLVNSVQARLLDMLCNLNFRDNEDLGGILWGHQFWQSAG